MNKYLLQALITVLIVLTGSPLLFAQTIQRTYRGVGVLNSSEWETLSFVGGGDIRTRARITAQLPTRDDGIVGIEFIMKGGDGGTATWDGVFEDKIGYGGVGGTVRFTLPITADNEGDPIYFFLGTRGESGTHSLVANGGGGGATAIARYSDGTNPIAVAAGGGGGAAIEARVSHGYGGGVARVGKSSCGYSGALGMNTALVQGGYNGEGGTRFALFAGGGGSYEDYPEDDRFDNEIKGNTPAEGGAGGYHPYYALRYGPCTTIFDICYDFEVRDINRGGCGWAGGGAGAAYIPNSAPSCPNVIIGEGAAGGGGAGYVGGGAGDLERGGGGGRSFIHPNAVTIANTEGGITSTPTNGYIRYRVIYDEEPPVALCKDLTIALDGDDPVSANGQVTISPADLDAGSYDDFYVSSLSLSKTTFTCEDLGTNTVTLTVLDGKGNGATCTANVTVVDTSPPYMPLFPLELVEMNNTSKEIKPKEADLNIRDNCDDYSVNIGSRTVTCADIGRNINIPVEVTDSHGNSATYYKEYRIVKEVPPIVKTKPTTLYLDASGKATLSPDAIDDNSIAENTCYSNFTKTVSKTEFNCTDVGIQNVTLTVHDGYNSASATVEVEVINPYAVVYVDRRAQGANNGSSWKDAYTHLQDALLRSDNCGLSEIWVAQGTYMPGDSEYDSFVIPEGVKLIGGFQGYESDPGQRNLNASPTVLSGDLNKNAIADPGDSHSVVTVTVPDIIVDGFIVEYSYADDPSDESQLSIGRTGGGVYVGQGGMFTLKNSILRNNKAVGDGSNGGGAGLISFGGTSKLINCLFYNNQATDLGGAVGGIGNMELINCTLANNTASNAGGIALYGGDLLVANTILVNNSGDQGNIEYGGSGEAHLKYSLVYDGAVSDAVIQTNTLMLAPQFEDPLQGGFTLKTSSPAINAGSNEAYTTAGGSVFTDFDLAGNPRIQNENIAIGAYEPNACQDYNSIVYVDKNATGNNDGSDWSNAFTRLESALALQETCNFRGEIRIAGGQTFYPSTARLCTSGCDNPRAKYFLIHKDIQLKGSFVVGTDTQDFSNPTRLSGDIGVPDDKEDNSYHVVVTKNLSTAALIEGFDITLGNANGSGVARIDDTSVGNNHGAGMYNTSAFPTLINIHFSKNSADLGAAMYNINASPRIINSVFYYNSAEEYGGGIYNEIGSPEIINATFVGNSAAVEGGGIYSYSLGSTILYNSVLYNNTPSDIYLSTSTASVSSNSTHNFSETSYLLGNSTISFTPLDYDPFLDSSKTAGISGLSPANGSVLVNAGINDFNLQSADGIGKPRIWDKTIDVGALENQLFILKPDVNNILYVDKNVKGGNEDGSGWNDAVPQLTQALKWAKYNQDPNWSENPLQIWVAQGTYMPGSEETASFTIPGHVRVLGGFAGNETSVDQRNWALNPVILNGDLNQDQIVNAGDSHTVVSLLADHAEINGVYIQGGFADDATDDTSVAIGRGGAGVYNNGDNRIYNCVFRNNIAATASGIGGGLVSFGGTLELINTLMYANEATANGGAISAEGGTINLINCTIADNKADRGGGVHFFSGSIQAVNSIFSNNSGGNGNFNDDGGAGTGTANHCLFFNETEDNTGKLPPDITGSENLEAVFPKYNTEYTLDYNSPAVDAGDTDAKSLEKDLNGVNRISNSTIDIGAYEVKACSDFGLDSIIYVDQTATGRNNGSDWKNAFKSLEYALSFQESCGFAGEIRVAGGQTFRPSTSRLCTSGCDSPRASYFLIHKDIQLKGSYVTGTDKQDYTNPTILSGDIGVLNDKSDNTFTVLVTQDLTNAAILNGFLIEEGSADGTGDRLINGHTFPLNKGGGIFNDNSSLNIMNTSFMGNEAGYGGGLYNRNATPLLVNTTFAVNAAEHNGGAMFNQGASLNLVNSAFFLNSADNGAGVYNDDALTTFTNTTFVDNSAHSEGGGVFNSNSSQVTYYNSVLFNNGSGDIYNEASTSLNPDSAKNFSETAYTQVGFTQLETNPFINSNNPIGEDGVWGTPDDGLYPAVGSVLIDAGNNIHNAQITDIAGIPRILEAAIDVGAYEYFSWFEMGNIAYVDQTATGANNGSDWENAFTRLEDALALQDLGFSGQIRVAGGQTFKPSTSRGCSNCNDPKMYYFLMNKDIQLKGGYIAGTNEQDYTNPTVLSGNLGNSDSTSDLTNHVMIALNLSDSALIDGLTITKGSAATLKTSSIYDTTIYNIGGGGLCLYDSSLRITNTSFKENYASLWGGGAWINDGTPKLTNTTFIDNTTSGQGRGGGIYIDQGSPIFVNSIFLGNSSEYYGAGIHITGGSAHIINTTFTNNEGSGIRLEGSSNVKLYNSVFFDNSSLDISTTSSESSVIGKNTFIEESYGIDDSGFNLLSSTPFLNSGNPKGDDGVLGTSDDGLYPATESLLVNAGANELNPEGTDIAGNSRIYQTIDIGAYEMQTPVLKPDVNNTIYVDKNIEGGNEDGSNWDNAVPELAMALEWAKRNETSWSESNTLKVWVARASYTPGVNEKDSFTIPGYVEVLGGFNGAETSITQRDWVANPTILSGDLNKDQTENIGDSHTVVTMVGNQAMLNGFYIQGGYADDATDDALIAIGRAGAGVYNNGDNSIYNCVFRNNTAATASGIGGALVSFGGTIALINTLMYANEATANGGAISAEGGTINMINCTIADNKANRGGGVHFFRGSIDASNTIFSNNEGINGNFNNDGGSGTGTANHCLFFNETSGNSGTLPVGIIGANNIIELAPEFLNDYILKNTSAAINSGSNEAYIQAVGDLDIDIDLAGNPRLIEGIIDIGTYEVPSFDLKPNTNNILFVNKEQRTGESDGSSWANAVSELADALKWAKYNQEDSWETTPLQIWVAGGTYTPLYSPKDENFGKDEGRSNAFLLVKNVQLYGGFAGNESILAERDLSNTENTSILSGDRDFNDVLSDPIPEIGNPYSKSSTANNTYHVLIGAGEMGKAQVDGFIITKGNANGSDGYDVNDIYLSSSIGGGIFLNKANPILKNLTIYGNESEGFGGGILNIASSPTLINSVIYRNSSNTQGGGIANSNKAAPFISHITIAKNKASSGVALFNYYNSVPSITNSIIWGEIINDTATPTYSYSLIKDNSDTSNQNLDASEITEFDLFKDPDNDDYSVLNSSAIVDAGSNTAYINMGGDLTSDTDISGKPRLNRHAIDIGAFEGQNAPPNVNCKNITVYLNDLGIATLTPEEVDDGSSDTEGEVTLSIDIDHFDCDDIGENPVVLTVEDEDGASATCVALVTVSDNTAPVADVSVLTDITAECEVVSLTPPTATDNCSAKVSVTHNATLPITESTTITWTYADASGNTSTQTQQVVILDSPLAQVTFEDQAYVYDGTSKSLELYNLPDGAIVTYSNNEQTEAGVYEVSALVSLPNKTCPNQTFTAVLTIEKAPQEITFPSLDPVSLDSSADFQLEATTSSGLPIIFSYTYSTSVPAALVTPTGFVSLVQSGRISITATQAGNENYLPAAEITQDLVVTSGDARITSLTIGETEYTDPEPLTVHTLDCGYYIDELKISYETEANVTGNMPNTFTLDVSRPGVYHATIVVTSEDGKTSRTYKIEIIKHFFFEDIVVQKFNNTLLVNNNPETNGGYRFVSYTWYKNGQIIGDGQYFSEGDAVTDLLDPSANYRVELTTIDGDVLSTCLFHVELKTSGKIYLAPNPVQATGSATLFADFDKEELKDMKVSILSIGGTLIDTFYTSTSRSTIQMPVNIQAGVYLLVCETSKQTQSIQFIVY